MNNICFHITDIVANSVRANASIISVEVDIQKDLILLQIEDNGIGMDKETLSRATNPFYTTRNTRRVGMGLPFLIQSAEQTGGGVKVYSTLGKGTVVKAEFISTNVDCPPMGDLAQTISLLLTGNPKVNICFTYKYGTLNFSVNTEDIKSALGDLPLSHPKVVFWVKELIEGNIKG